MYSYSLILLSALASVASATPVLAKRYTAPQFTIKPYTGNATDPTWVDTVTRDGGGGATINGHNIIVFSDTSTSTPSGSFAGFTSNSAAFVRYLFDIIMESPVLSTSQSLILPTHLHSRILVQILTLGKLFRSQPTRRLIRLLTQTLDA
jgi:hypothetical protein